MHSVKMLVIVLNTKDAIVIAVSTEARPSKLMLFTMDRKTEEHMQHFTNQKQKSDLTHCYHGF
jgi:hypothetical protein